GEQAGIAAPQPTEAQQIAASEEMAAPTYEPALVGTGSQMQVVQGDLSDRAIITDPVTGELRPESKAEAVVRESPPEAFIADQLTTLLTGMEGGEIPSWAKPAVDAAEAELAQRGMGNSSVARDSLYNAIIQSALPIATGDAATAQQTFLANLNNEQQAVMFNAAQMANMDMANATYAQQAQAQNAQAFLQMDFANLDYEMQTAVINQQAMEQAMLSDQAAQNAASQFNATSESQTQQFIESLRVQIADANASRQLAADQFNTEQTLAIESFNSDLAFQRDKFNAQNALLIEQSNVEWRRAVNTANTVAINEANQQNAMNAFNLSTTALASLWQEYRDNAKMAFESAENKLDRQNRITLVSMGADADAAIAASEANSSLGAGLGAAVGMVAAGPLGAAVGAGIGGAIGSMW
nr:hypothetical protein [Gammaproteobacteria bacterium]